MLSLLSISAVKSAVEICHIPKLKVKMLRAHESEKDINKGEDSLISENVQIEIENIIISLKIPKELQEILMCLVSRIGIRMLRWVEYHEEILNFSRDYSVTLLTPSFFTARGIIDSTKAAKELMNIESLDVKQKYVLSCVYCFIKNVNALFQEMTNLDKKIYYHAQNYEDIKQLEMVKYWTYYQMNKIDKLTNDDLNAYKIKIAVGSGNIAAIDHFLQERILIQETDAIVEVAIEAIRSLERTAFERDPNSKITNVPRDYFADIVCYLLSRMERSQKIEFLERDILDNQYKFDVLEYQYSRVLEWLLNWPYQDYFMKTVAVMWEFLPEWNYVYLLLLIIRKIGVGSQEFDGEIKSFDYRRLLREFWCQSHERHKMFVLNNETIIYWLESRLEAGVSVLMNLFSLPDFTNDDIKNIQIILADATDKQKENIICCKKWEDNCNDLISEKTWKILRRFDQDEFFNKKARTNFKKNFCRLETIKPILLPIFQNDKLDEVESFIEWTSLPEEYIKKLKRDIIYSDWGIEEWISLIYDGKTETAERLISWCFSSERDVKLFKKKFIFSKRGTKRCADLIRQNKFELSNEFINFFVSSSEDIKELKKKIAYDFGDSICKKFISSYENLITYFDENVGHHVKKVKFTGGKWEEVEKFITFCFSSEDEINDFKRKWLLKIPGKDIHFDLIKLCKLEEAETFFRWLGLSEDEVKKLKKGTLFDHSEAKTMFIELIHKEEGHAWFADYGNKDEAIELLLRWCLIDKDAVLEFRDEYLKWYQDLNYTNKDDMLRNLNLIIEQLLEDFDIELD